MPTLEHTSSRRVHSLFDLSGRVAVITGGAGLLGVRHAEAIAEMGGIPVLADLDGEKARAKAEQLSEIYGVPAIGLGANITNPQELLDALDAVLKTLRKVDILINNAANDPKVDTRQGTSVHWSRLERFSLDLWNRDISVGLTGAFLCSQVFGAEMARRGKGVIINIASDLGLIAPDQRIYRQPDLPDDQQPVKPVSYSVVKHGLIGLTRYLATYWAEHGVRVNALCPGGVSAGQDDTFVTRLTHLIPLRRMADKDEYKAAIVFLASDASSYMTGADLIIDGGRTAW
jgi:NAD(P)-dependent dehydrogenase (short-subunit alcohol dehydrogenase family)